MTAKIYFNVIAEEEVESDAITVEIEDGTIFRGNEPDESLACGSCKYVFARHITTRFFIGNMLQPAGNRQILLKCHCGALNLLRSKSDAS